MIRLTDKPEDWRILLSIKGEAVPINVSFNRVLTVMEMQSDPYLTELDKLLGAFYVFVPDHEKYIGIFQMPEIYECVQMILERVLSDGSRSDGEAVIDFSFDAERIYASFLSTYGMDLFQHHDRLSWRRFMALFSGLSEDSPIMRAIHYRTCELPKGKERAEERKHILKMRRLYELPEQKRAREKALLSTLEAFKKELEHSKEGGHLYG